MVTQLLTLMYIGDDFHDDESHIGVCSVIFTDSCERPSNMRRCYHGMERPRVGSGGDGLQIWKVLRIY